MEETDQVGSAEKVGAEVAPVAQPKVGEAPKPAELGNNLKPAPTASVAELMRHAAEVDANIVLASRPQGSGPAPRPGDKAEIDAQTVYLGINDKPYDSVGSTRDLTGKPLVQADGGHSGPGTASYVGTAMRAVEGGKVGIVAPASAPIADPAAAGWQAATK